MFIKRSRLVIVDYVNSPEHLLAIVEPHTDSDTTLELARNVIERGGRADVVVLLTARARHSIRAFARNANLGIGDATEIAVDRLSHEYRTKAGQGALLEIAHEPTLRRQLDRHLSPATTSIALPPHLASRRTLRRLTDRTGLPIVVAPRHAA